MSIGPSLTFSVGRMSFLDLSILFGSIWDKSVAYCFISNTKTRIGLPSIVLIGSGISSLYWQGVLDSTTANCKGYD